MSDLPQILVTGGAGYIGSHVCRALSQSGFVPIVYDNLCTGHRRFVQGEFVEGDVLDANALDQVFSARRIAAVMHFAALSVVGDSVTDPQSYYINNVIGTLTLLRTMLKHNCTRLVFSSTGAVYGETDSKVIPEQFQCAPANPYGASKWMVERILGDYRTAYGLQAFCLRYFNAAGADLAGDIGELRDKETHLIPRAMMALQGHLSEFAIFGDDYETPDGTAVRDYIHVTDLAAAHLSALNMLLSDHAGGSYNLGTGSGFSVRQILSAIKTVTGRDVPHVVRARRPGDPTYLVADPSAAKQLLRFNPRHSDLETIIRTAWQWHQNAHPFK